MANLTEQQARVLEVIRESIREHGYPPSVRELGKNWDSSQPRRYIRTSGTLSERDSLRGPPRSPGPITSLLRRMPGKPDPS